MPTVHIDWRRASIVIAAVVPPGLALALVPFRSSVGGPVVVLVLVLAITASAAYGTVVAGIVASASASLSFDFWFAPPFNHLSIVGRNDVESTVLLFVIGAAVSALATHARRGAALAATRAGYLAMLHDFAEMVATGEPADFVVIRAAAELSQLLDLSDCQFEPTASDPRLPRLEAGGDVYLSGEPWDVGQLGMPGRRVELLVESHGQSRGRFLLSPTPGRPITRDRRIVAVALADQVGAVLSGRLRNDGTPNAP
jgi:hypothetical protein